MLRKFIKYFTLVTCIFSLYNCVFLIQHVEARHHHHAAPRNRGRAAVVTRVGASAAGIARSNSQQVNEGTASQRKQEELDAAAKFLKENSTQPNTKSK